MEEVIKKELFYDLDHSIEILESREKKDVEELKILSDHGIENVAAYKNLDLISLSVLIYSLYKIITRIPDEDYNDILQELKNAKKNLEQGNLGRYNSNIKTLFSIVKRSNIKIKEHLQDVLDAAKIKKSAILLQKGLSIGQAAGLMGLTNWDLQQYAGKTTTHELSYEGVSAKKRTNIAFKFFGVS
ncbi:MAG: hypothetical protein KKA62_02365 [Nanoarchaeota archaeon]|nr:hypothetical protein [Nanoarchaeota archaeon]MBU1643678.1 hypothetical protein [Nanoarchaeota archaeon]MBU1976776.1 hypothetical protein [Nanoarchaeota archaeon]